MRTCSFVEFSETLCMCLVFVNWPSIVFIYVGVLLYYVIEDATEFIIISD